MSIQQLAKASEECDLAQASRQSSTMRDIAPRCFVQSRTNHSKSWKRRARQPNEAMRYASLPRGLGAGSVVNSWGTTVHSHP